MVVAPEGYVQFGVAGPFVRHFGPKMADKQGPNPPRQDLYRRITGNTMCDARSPPWYTR